MGTDRQTPRERVLSYLYGTLNPAETAAFRAELSTDAELARLLAEEEGLHEVLPVGQGAEVPDAMVAESHARLRAALRPASPSSPPSRASRWLLPVWAVGAAALVTLGVGLERTVLSAADSGASNLADNLVDLRVVGLDRDRGQLRLELRHLVTTTLEGRLDDERLQGVLAAALLRDLEPGPRIEAVELLRVATAADPTRQALVHAVLHDDNPGVRVAAAEALRDLAADGAIRRALHQALLEDTNPGVRIAAVEGLRGLRDAPTRQVLERAAQYETNEYIRNEARRALQGPPTQL